MSQTRITLHLGDCLEVLRGYESESIHAVVTDPPYGLSAPPDISEVLRHWLAGDRYEHGRPGFMGRDWDSFVPGPEVWRQLHRVMLPGAHAVVFASTRTVDLMGIALRLAKFEIRDCGQWCYWSGFPKSLDLSQEIDRLAGAEREVVGTRLSNGRRTGITASVGQSLIDAGREIPITAPATPEARQWSGWHTALKPCVEPWLLVRKPIRESSIARQVLATSTGGLNIDATRFRPGDPRGGVDRQSLWLGPNDGADVMDARSGSNRGLVRGIFGFGNVSGELWKSHAAGRWPGNLLYCPKASRAERERGLGDGFPTRTAAEATHSKEGQARLNSRRTGAGRSAEAIRNHHPTVKPVRLLRFLVKLVTPPDGIVLDPFMGSGSTGIAAAAEGFAFHGIELDPEFLRIAKARIAYAAPGQDIAAPAEADVDIEPAAQGSLF